MYSINKEFVDFNVHEAGREKLRKDQGRATAAPELSADQADTCLHEFCIAEMKQTTSVHILDTINMYRNQQTMNLPALQT